MSDEKLLTVSWSRLKAWQQCKHKAYWQSKGVRNRAGDIRIFFKGTLTDRILRHWLQDTDRQPNTMSGMVQEFADKYEAECRDTGQGIARWKHIDDRAQALEWCERLLVKVEPLMNDLVVPYLPYVEADKHVKAVIRVPDLFGQPKEIQLIGIMDIFIDTEPFMAIYDLKATENPNYWKSTIMQLAFYDLIVQSYKGVKPHATALIQPMCQQTIVPFEVTKEHTMDIVRNVTSYAHSVWSEDFAPKESDAGCSWCPVKQACIKFKKGEDGRLSWV